MAKFRKKIIQPDNHSKECVNCNCKRKWNLGTFAMAVFIYSVLAAFLVANQSGETRSVSFYVGYYFAQISVHAILLCLVYLALRFVQKLSKQSRLNKT